MLFPYFAFPDWKRSAVPLLINPHANRKKPGVEMKTAKNGKIKQVKGLS
jgi:hypothetical protein